MSISPPKAWEHPAVWTGDELLRRPEWEWGLTPTELAELDDLVESLTTDRDNLESLSPIGEDAPQLVSKMEAIRLCLENGPGAVLLRGFPAGRHPVTRAAGLFWRMMQAVGTPVQQTAEGQSLFYVQDEGYDDQHPKARGPSSRKRLSFHTDRCDVIAFLCVRQARSGGENQLLSSMALFNRILAERPDLLQTLCQPFYYRRHNVDPGNELAFYQQPVFTSCRGHFAANLMRVLIERAHATPEIGPMPQPQRDALDYLQMVADDPQLFVEYRQEPGDILLLNNYVTLHRRSEFVDHADADRRRLLLRLWLAVPNSRPLDPCYAASYGATEAGSVRGGMRPL